MIIVRIIAGFFCSLLKVLTNIPHVSRRNRSIFLVFLMQKMKIFDWETFLNVLEVMKTTTTQLSVTNNSAEKMNIYSNLTKQKHHSFFRYISMNKLRLRLKPFTRVQTI